MLSVAEEGRFADSGRGVAARAALTNPDYLPVPGTDVFVHCAMVAEVSPDLGSGTFTSVFVAAAALKEQRRQRALSVGDALVNQEASMSKEPCSGESLIERKVYLATLVEKMKTAVGQAAVKDVTTSQPSDGMNVDHPYYADWAHHVSEQPHVDN